MNTRVGCHFLLQGIVPIQGLNSGLPHCRQTLYCLSPQGSPNTQKAISKSLAIGGALQIKSSRLEIQNKTKQKGSKLGERRPEEGETTHPRMHSWKVLEPPGKVCGWNIQDGSSRASGRQAWVAWERAPAHGTLLSLP